jgi:hypothetical protein
VLHLFQQAAPEFLLDVLGVVPPGAALALLCCQLRYNPRPDGSKDDFILRKSGNRQRVYRIVVMTQNMKQTIPAAISVAVLAAQMATNPRKLRLAIGLVAASGYTVNLGLGIHVKVEKVVTVSVEKVGGVAWSPRYPVQEVQQ